MVWPPGGVSPHFWEGYPRSLFRVFFSDMKSTFKPLSPYNGHGSPEFASTIISTFR